MCLCRARRAQADPSKSYEPGGLINTIATEEKLQGMRDYQDPVRARHAHRGQSKATHTGAAV